MAKKVATHAYFPGIELLNNDIQAVVNKLKRQDISAVWLAVNNSQAVGKILHLLQSKNILFVLIPLHKQMVQYCIQLHPYGLAISPHLVQQLLEHRAALLEKNITVYLTQQISGDLSSFATDSMTQLNDLINAVELLQAEQLSNIVVHIHHPSPAVEIALNIYLKNRYHLPHIISFTPYMDKHSNLLMNSILLGNLFYEKVADAILLKPAQHTFQNHNYLEEAVALVKKILSFLGIISASFTLVSCPKCGRCRMDLLALNKAVHKELCDLEIEYQNKGKNLADIGGLNVAVMGCNVNGPGEAKNADIGVAGDKNKRATIFKYGIPLITLPEEVIVAEFKKEVKKLLDERFEAFNRRVSFV